MLQTGEFQERAAKLGEQLYDGLTGLIGHGIDGVRARGLWAGIDIAPDKMTGREFTEALLGKGVLAKEAHGQTVRLASPIVSSEADIDLLVTSFRSDGFGKWFRWPGVAFVVLGLALLIGIAYLLARILTRPLVRLAGEVAAVARGEPNVQPAVGEAAGRELYQVATTHQTV